MAWWLAQKWSRRLSLSSSPQINKFGRHRPPTRSCEVSNNYHMSSHLSFPPTWRPSSSLITAIPSLKLPLIFRQSKTSGLLGQQLHFLQQNIFSCVLYPRFRHHINFSQQTSSTREANQRIALRLSVAYRFSHPIFPRRRQLL